MGPGWTSFADGDAGAAAGADGLDGLPPVGHPPAGAGGGGVRRGWLAALPILARKPMTVCGSANFTPHAGSGRMDSVGWVCGGPVHEAHTNASSPARGGGWSRGAPAADEAEVEGRVKIQRLLQVLLRRMLLHGASTRSLGAPEARIRIPGRGEGCVYVWTKSIRLKILYIRNTLMVEASITG